MNSKNNPEDDIMRQYIDPQRIENAPEGFTQNVMTRIQLETRGSVIAEKRWARMRVPAISVCITLILIIAVYLLPDYGISQIQGLTFLNNFKFPDLKISTDPFSGIKIPAIITYLIAGVVLLFVFDKALNRLFHREK
jgi:hypothetical protein